VTKRRPLPALHLSLLLPVLLLGACAGNPRLEEGRALIAAGRDGEGLARLEETLREHPEDREVRAYYFRQRELAAGAAIAAADAAQRAGAHDAAEAAWRRALEIDPGNARARNGLAEAASARRHRRLYDEAVALAGREALAEAEAKLRTILAENGSHEGARALQLRLREREAARPQPEAKLKAAFARPVTLDFRDTPLKAVFEFLSRTAGLNFVLDKDVKADAKVSLYVRDTRLDEILRLVMATNQLRHVVIGESSILVHPDNPAKTKAYQETVTRSFYLANADAKQAQTLLKTIVKSKDVFIDEKLNLVILRDTPDAVRLAERLIASLDLAEPEVMLEIEVLELSRSRLLELGLRFPDQVGYGILQPTTTSTVITTTGTQTNTIFGGTLASGVVDLHARDALTSYVPNPALLLNLKNQTGDGSLLANPRIRVKNREKAKIHIGDKLPVFTTTSTANVGVSASVSYLDVGLKLDVEPSVHLDDEVDIKVGLEVSSIAREVAGPAQSVAYQVGTRSAATTLRLRHGETQVLAGLINDEERSSASRLPGLGDLPLIGRLFSSTRDSTSKTEIVLLVTPRIVRNLARPALAAPTLAAGTETDVGAPPLALSGGGVGMSTRGGAPAQPEPAEDAEPAEAPAPQPPAAESPEANSTDSAAPMAIAVPLAPAAIAVPLAPAAIAPPPAPAANEAPER
jgi:general secretion pathway protein D